MPVHTLTELQYSKDREGPFRLYIYGKDGKHDGCIWVRRVPEEADEIDCTEAIVQTLEAAAQGFEVRITDDGDMLVYHCKGADVLYPKPIGNFWKEICEEKKS